MRQDMIEAIEEAERAPHSLGRPYREMRQKLVSLLQRELGPAAPEIAELEVIFTDGLPPLAETHASMDELGRDEPTHRARQSRVLREVRAFVDRTFPERSVASERRLVDTSDQHRSLNFERQIGEGGFAGVWLATDHLGRRVAVKVFLPTEVMVSSAADHARALARVRHPNVVTVHDVVRTRDPVNDGEVVDAVIMELLDGPTVAERLSGPQFTRVEAERVGKAILAGIRAIHAEGIAHGDLHEGNVMLDAQQHPHGRDWPALRAELVECYVEPMVRLANKTRRSRRENAPLLLRLLEIEEALRIEEERSRIVNLSYVRNLWPEHVGTYRASVPGLPDLVMEVGQTVPVRAETAAVIIADHQDAFETDAVLPSPPRERGRPFMSEDQLEALRREQRRLRIVLDRS